MFFVVGEQEQKAARLEILLLWKKKKFHILVRNWKENNITTLFWRKTFQNNKDKSEQKLFQTNKDKSEQKLVNP